MREMSNEAEALFDCGEDYEYWAAVALTHYLPKGTLKENQIRLAIISMCGSDGRRLARSFYENREVIVLAEHLLCARRLTEDHPEVRYFVYVVLHELAHAIKRHLSPLLDGLTEQQAKAQETEADELALQWYNGANRNLPGLSREEIEKAQAMTVDRMKSLRRQ